MLVGETVSTPRVAHISRPQGQEPFCECATESEVLKAAARSGSGAPSACLTVTHGPSRTPASREHPLGSHFRNEKQIKSKQEECPGWSETGIAFQPGAELGRTAVSNYIPASVVAAGSV